MGTTRRTPEVAVRARRKRRLLDDPADSSDCAGCGIPIAICGGCVLLIFIIIGSFAGSSRSYFNSDERERYRSEPDLKGFEWFPVTDRAVLRCMNLETVLRTPKLRNGVGTFDKENAAWKSEGCEELLTKHHRAAAPIHRSQSGDKCVTMKEVLGIVPGGNWGSAGTKEKDRYPPAPGNQSRDAHSCVLAR